MVSQDAIAPAPAEQVQAPSAFELGDVLRILSERRNIILGAAAIGLVLGILVSLVMTPLYRATALLELNSPANEIIDAAGGKMAGGGQSRTSSTELLGTQQGLLQSETLMRRVVEDLNLVSNPEFGGSGGTRETRTKRAIGQIRRNLNVEPVKNSLLMRVGYLSPDPKIAAQIANAVASGSIAAGLERRYDSSSYARTFLSEQLARTKAALEESERNLNTYGIDAGLFRMPGTSIDGKTQEGATLAVRDLEALNAALNDARIKRIAAEQVYRSATLDSTSGTESVSGMVQERASLQAQYAENSKLFKPDYPQMRQIAASIERLDKSINDERSRTSDLRRAELRAEYQAALRSEGELEAQLAEAKGEVLTERTQSIQYNILQREADTNRALYDALLQRYKEIGVAGGIGQSNVSLIDEAVPPTGPYSPNLPVNALIGLVLGMSLGVALAFAIHHLFDNIIDPADVRRKLHLPVLGVIPMEQEDRSLMEALADRKSDVSEAYYSLRTALTFIRKEGPPSSLLVTSTRPGEGKSTTSYAIARNMARAGRRVLLIDADLRKPTFVSTRDDGHGLAYLLGSDEPLADYIQGTQEENLSLLPVGRFVGSAAELLSSTRLPIIVNEAKASYDMVIVDGPPVLGLTDAPLLGSVAECTLYVVQSRSARTSNVIEMIRRLSESGTEMLGVVLTKVTSGVASYGYDYYSYNYGGGDVGGVVSSDPMRKLDLSPQRD